MWVLRHREDLRSLAFVAFYLGLVSVAWVLDAQHPLLRYGLVVPIALWSFFCAVITHNTIHAPVFRVRWMNTAFHCVLSLCYGHPVSSYVPGHNLSHHKWLQGPRDIMRTTKLRFRWNLLNQLFFLPRVAWAITRAENAYMLWARKHRPRWFRGFLLESAILYGTYAALLVTDWRRFVLYVWIPHLYAAWGIVGINFVQHDGCDETHPVNHSRNFVGKLVNWFTFNNGYHGIHHMKPWLHWSLAPAEHARLLSPTIDPALEQRSLLAYLWRAYVWPGKRVDYRGQPVRLPPPVPDEPWFGEGVPPAPPALHPSLAALDRRGRLGRRAVRGAARSGDAAPPGDANDALPAE
jgi:fatty acid desaturase